MSLQFVQINAAMRTIVARKLSVVPAARTGPRGGVWLFKKQLGVPELLSVLPMKERSRAVVLSCFCSSLIRRSTW